MMQQGITDGQILQQEFNIRQKERELKAIDLSKEQKEDEIAMFKLGLESMKTMKKEQEELMAKREAEDKAKAEETKTEEAK